jgi:hypothetical protein
LFAFDEPGTSRQTVKIYLCDPAKGVFCPLRAWTHAQSNIAEPDDKIMNLVKEILASRNLFLEEIPSSVC